MSVKRDNDEMYQKRRHVRKGKMYEEDYNISSEGSSVLYARVAILLSRWFDNSNNVYV